MGYGIFHGILTGSMTAINSLCDHLWYILSYIKIVIWIPVLWLICKEEKNAKLARRIIIAFGLIGAVIIDIQRFITLPQIGAIKVFGLVDRELLYVLLGYELFVHKDKIKGNKKLFVLSGITFLLINFIRYKIEVQYMVINNFVDVLGRESFITWRDTALSLISSIALFAGIYSLQINNEKISKVITWVADKTFGIYLIHYLIIAKVDLYKFEVIEKFYAELIYLGIGIVTTFVASLLIVVLLKKFKKCVSFLKKI